jgi:hypothetical protein
MLISMDIFGPPVREPDEGTGAHLFQIWLVLEVLMITFFAISWFPRKPTQAAIILGAQIIAALLPMGIVYFFNL